MFGIPSIESNPLGHSSNASEPAHARAYKGRLREDESNERLYLDEVRLSALQKTLAHAGGFRKQSKAEICETPFPISQVVVGHSGLGITVGGNTTLPALLMYSIRTNLELGERRNSIAHNSP